MTLTIRWIVYPRVVPIDTVETERVEETDLDKLVDECAARLDEVRHRHADHPPNGVQILNEEGDVVRQFVDRSKPV